MAAQEPVLVSADIPNHPRLACQARIAGEVKLTFVLSGNAGEPTNVEVISGHPLLNDAAMENVKRWKFRNSYAEGKYVTTFDYRFPSSGSQKVTFESFHRLEICTCLPRRIDE
jgi:TonB family protein